MHYQPVINARRTLSSDHGPVSIETLTAGSSEYVAVADQLHATIPAAVVVAIEKVHNQSIEERYDLLRRQMLRRNAQNGLGAPEWMLWHGTR
jgi:hypothetical protein